MFGEFFKTLLTEIWSFLFELGFVIDGYHISFGGLICFSMLFVVGLRVIAVLVNSYSHDD